MAIGGRVGIRQGEPEIFSCERIGFTRTCGCFVDGEHGGWRSIRLRIT